VEGSGFRVYGLEGSLQELGFRVHDLAFRVCGSWFRVYG
jgi:hypothetical protein